MQQARARLGLPVQGDDDAIDPEKTSIVRSAGALLGKRGSHANARRPSSSAASRPRPRSTRPTPPCRWRRAATRTRSRKCATDRPSSNSGAPNWNGPSGRPRHLPHLAARRHRPRAPRHRGQYLAAGSPAVTIVRMHPLRLRVAVPERDAQSVRVNQVVQVTVEGDTTSYTGRVARISPAIDEASRTLMVEAEVPNPGGLLRPGSFANASIVSAQIRSGSHRAHLGAGDLCRRGQGPERERRQGRRKARHRRTPRRRAHRDPRWPGGRRPGGRPARQPGRRDAGPRRGRRRSAARRSAASRQ